MKYSITRFVSPLLLGVLLSAPLPALAAGLELKSEAFQDVTVKAKDGKVQKKRQAVTTAVPGTEIIYVLSYRNTGAQPARDVVINNPLPAEMRYVAGSAEGAGARAEVSVDGGKLFGVLEALQVADAEGKPRPARGEDVTHVRWAVVGAVAPGKSGTLSYRAIVR